MEQFATKEQTTNALKSLGFIAVEEDGRFFDSPKQDGWGLPVVQAHIYQCLNRYWCVELNGDHSWKGPCVWNGPKAEWDKSDILIEFKTYLDTHYPGWT